MRTIHSLLLLGILTGVASTAKAADIAVPGDAPTIKAALAQAEAGDTVRVGEGTFREFISIKTGVSLVGAGADKTALLPPEGGGCVIMLNEVRDVWIDGFTVRAEAHLRAVDALTSSFTLSNCVIEGNHEGVGVTACFLTTLKHNLFRDNATDIRSDRAYPALLRNRFAGGERSETAVLCLRSTPYLEGNVFSGYRCAVRLSGAGEPILRNNVFFGASETGLAIEDRSRPIARNNVFQKMPKGVFVDFASASLSHNDFFQVPFPYATIDEETGDDTTFEPSPGVGETMADPGFLDARRGNFRLGEDSPARGAGVRKPSEPGDVETHQGCYPHGEEAKPGPLSDADARAACFPSGHPKVNSIQEEYAVLRYTPCPCGGTYKAGRQALSRIDGRPHDRLMPTCTSCGKPGRFVFDISRFFGERMLVRKK